MWSDGRYIARAGTTEASLSNDSFRPGLFVVAFTTPSVYHRAGLGRLPFL